MAFSPVRASYAAPYGVPTVAQPLYTQPVVAQPVVAQPVGTVPVVQSVPQAVVAPPVRGESRVEYVPYQRSYIEYEE